MATALSLITRALRLAGVPGTGETLDTDESADGLDALNTMLDSWQLERLFVYQVVQGSYTWPAATTSRTIGTGGNFAAQRPVRIESAFVMDSNSQWYPLHIITDRADYDAIVTKTTQSTLPSMLFMDPAFPLGVIYLYPVPSVEVTLKLNTWQTLQSFTDLTTELSLPPGYKRAIEYNLAIEYGPEFDADIPADVRVIATQSKSAIKNINAPAIISRLDIGRSRYNVFSDS